jgi:NodT family efflux transporter outer membrane factor (OMF) lipoprotein
MNDTTQSGGHSRRYTLLTLIVASVMGAGCGARRPYQPPVPNAPATWSAAVGESADAESLSRWWETFGDEQLIALVRRAVEGNLDVRTAMSRLREARATTRSTRTQLSPSADVGGSARASGTGNEAGVSGVTGLYTLSIDASWEIDAFGGIRSTIDAASATAEARAADLEDVLITLTADVALNYIDIRSLQRRLEIARSNVDLQQETLELTQFRAQSGLATDLDVQQARANVENTRAQIASFEGQVGRSIHAIAILLGRPPGELNAEFTAPAPLPEAPLETTLGLPADTLVYPGHDYLANNLKFTLAREPDNAAAQEMLQQAGGQDPASAVTTLADEKRINTFMRLDSPGVIAQLRKDFPELPEQLDAKTVFTKLRELRNKW